LSFERVAAIEDIPVGQGFCIKVGEVEVGLYRIDGRVFAMENRCPHRNFPLHEGSLSGTIITCSAHGWSFDVRTGFRPDDSDGWPLPCFEARVIDGQVWIDLESPTNLRR